MDFDDAARRVGDDAVRETLARAERTRLATPYRWRDPETIPPRRWIYGRQIQRGHVRALIAGGGSGKTILSVGEALSMATGRALLGHDVPGGRKRVWLWNLEDSGEELARIIQAACKHWQITRHDLEGWLFVDSAMDGAILKLAGTDVQGVAFNNELVREIVGELRDREIDYLHVDPFVSSHSVDESDNGAIDQVAKRWAMIAAEAESGIGLSHHVSKAGAATVTALSSRGAVALTDACRSVLTINRMTDEEATRYGIEGEARRRYLRTYDDKNNRAPPSDACDWYRLWSVDLCNGGDDPGDNMGVVVPWTPPDAFEGVTGDHLVRVQRAIDAGEYKAHHTAAEWAGHAVAEVLGLNIESKADKARILTMLKQWQDNRRFKVVERKDANRQMKKFLVVDEWADRAPATPPLSVASPSVAVLQPSATLHLPPFRGGSVAGAAAGGDQVSRPGGIDDPDDDDFDPFAHDPMSGPRTVF